MKGVETANMENITELETFFQQLVADASGVETVILADQDRSAPSGLYATYKPVPVRAYGHPRRNREDVDAIDSNIYEWTDFNETVITSMEFMLSCNFFNEGADSAAARVHNANFRISVQELLYVNEVAWRYCSEVRNLTVLSQAEMQPRFQLDIHLYVEMEVTEVVLRAAGFVFSTFNENGIQLYDGA